MKEIRETKLVEQTTVKFVADDGKEFATSEECKKHEYDAQMKKDNHAIERIEHELKIGEFTSSYDAEEQEVHLYRLNNVDDLFKLDFLFQKKFILDNSILEYKTVMSYPTTIAVFDRYRDYAYIPQRSEKYVDEKGVERYNYIPLTAKEVMDRFTERYEQFLSVANKI